MDMCLSPRTRIEKCEQILRGQLLLKTVGPPLGYRQRSLANFHGKVASRERGPRLPEQAQLRHSAGSSAWLGVFVSCGRCERHTMNCVAGRNLFPHGFGG